jgi:hypothetical protein
MLVAMVGFFMFLSIAPAPNENRMAASELSALILLTWFLDSPRRVARRLAAVLAVGVVLVAVYSVTRRRPIPEVTLATPLGRIAISDPSDYQEYAWLLRHTRASDFFYQAYKSEQYFYLDLRNPTPVPRLVNNGYTTTEQVAEVIRGLQQHHVRYISWKLDLDAALPKWENTCDAHLGPLRNYIHDHYRLAAVFDHREQVWQRND